MYYPSTTSNLCASASFLSVCPKLHKKIAGEITLRVAHPTLHVWNNSPLTRKSVYYKVYDSVISLSVVSMVFYLRPCYRESSQSSRGDVL